jgi:hypothetical protein
MLFVIITMSALTQAGERRTGSAGAAQLTIPVGAVGLGTSGALMSTVSGIESIYWNPAGLARGDKGEVMFSNMNYLADIGVIYIAGGVNLQNAGSFGFAVRSINFGDIPLTTASDPDGTIGNRTFSPSYITASLTYARAFTERTSIGISAKIISENIVNTSALGYAFDLGVQYKTPFDLNVGVLLKNLGGKMRYSGPDLQALVERTTNEGQQNNIRAQITAAEFELPASFELSASYPFRFDRAGKNVFTLGATFRNNNFSDDEYIVGGEYDFQKLFFLRGGYSFDTSENGQNVFARSFTVGAGVDYKLGGTSIRVDYTYRSAQYFSGNNSISVRLGF